LRCTADYEFGARQDVADEFGRKKTKIRARIAHEAKSPTKDIAAIRNYQDELSAVERRSPVQKALLHILRMLGDALVWRVLRALIALPSRSSATGSASDG
jgi:hypothetical protein